MKELIKVLRDYALANYDDGGHWVYETYDNSDYAEVLVDADGDIEMAKRYLHKDWQFTVEREEEIRNA